LHEKRGGFEIPPRREKIRNEGYQLAITGTAGDCESFLIPVLNVVDSSAVNPGFGTFGNQEIDAVDVNRLFVVFWLIQSQPDAGAVSAHPLKVKANKLSLAAAEGFLDLDLSFISNGKHFCTSLHKLFNVTYCSG